MSNQRDDRSPRLRTGRSLRLELLEPRHLLTAANLLVTEFMASNASAVTDGDGVNSDWIEIYNADAVAVDLSDYFLTDSADNLTRWAFPQVVLAPGEYFVVFASSPLDELGHPLDDYVDQGGKLHANFSLSAGGEYLGLVHEDPISHALSVVDEYAAAYPEQCNNVSYGVNSEGVLAYFTSFTPGAANGLGVTGAVADTSFSIDRGFYDAPFQVEITSETPGAQIFYTTNGSVPTQFSGTLYTGALTIDKTTVLRAAAYKADHLPTNVDTQTYLFVDDIVRQDRAATLAAGFPASWGSFSGTDYGLDPDVIGTFDQNGNSLGGDTFNGIYAATIKDDLLALPTLSIVMNMSDMFGTNGIYTVPTADGYEKAASVEWIATDGSEEFQIDAGIQIQGGAFRSHSLTRKHSFRLAFRGDYGASSLGFPLFGDSATEEFNTLVLRAGSNDSYSWNSARFTEQYVRDEFGRSLQRAAGHASPHGGFVHLYINGFYWGLYNPVERPDAEFAASYFGGEPGQWDSVHEGFPTSGDAVAWNAARVKAEAAETSLVDFMELQGKNLDGTPSATVAPLLNVESYIDYLAINIWGGNWDWPFKNYWAARDRNPDTTTGFEFFNWDFEGTMGNGSMSPLNATTLDQNFLSPSGGSSANAGRFHYHLENNPEYRIQFADRVHKFFFNGGILTPEALVERYAPLAAQVERAIVAESARWGDMHFPSSPLTLTEWTAQRDWILDTYLLERSAIVLQELKSFGLYPNVEAPTFSQHGGEVPENFLLGVSAPVGEMWYTLDGSDPRQIGGGINSAALLYDGNPLVISGETVVKARVLIDGRWSALNEAAFSAALTGDVTKLRITELHYHPVDAEEHEFIEVTNTSAGPVSLDGVSIGSFASEPYLFPNGLTLGAGERIVVARNPTIFQARYGDDIELSPLGYANANLSNGGESISLLGPGGQLLQHFTYDDAGEWPTAPDGGGPSLEYVGPFDQDAADPNDALGDPYDDPTNWRASANDGGSPGTDGNIVAADADFNGDGEVNGMDFLTWQRNYGRIGNALHSQGDADRNGAVNQHDLSAWESQYGAVGEPRPDDADFNDDGQVNGLDFLAWQVNYAMQSGASLDQGDANRDGAVDSDDLVVWESQYGNPPPLVAAITTGDEDPAPLAALMSSVSDGDLTAYAALLSADSAPRDEALEESAVDEIFLEVAVSTPAVSASSESLHDAALASVTYPRADDELAVELVALLDDKLV